MLNPENKCAQLMEQESKELTLKEMFEMQLSLQCNMFARGKGIDYVNGSFKEKVNDITIQFRNLNTEFVELLERLPWKEWKTYSPEQLSGWTSKEQELETKFEFVDMFHFFMNIGLLIGITPEEMTKMYYLKNKENFDRQERGY
jgi:dimeric dUTPase (all-alpha-NTP-PPase superfamily)